MTEVVEASETRTVFAAFMASAEAWPERPFLHIPASAARAYNSGAVDLSYAQTRQRVLELKENYQRCGYGVGHRVALLLENRADFFLHWFALNALGVSVVPINGEMSGEEMGYLLEHSEACLALALTEKREAMATAAAQAGLSLPVLGLEQLPALPPVPSPARDQLPGPDSECALLYTSGSTGKPKGCILNNEYFLFAGHWYRDLGGLCALEPGAERLLTPLPLKPVRWIDGRLR